MVDEALATVPEIDPDALAAQLPPRGYLLIDVREPNEYTEAHIPGALNFPRGFLEVRADLEHHKRDERLADRSQRIVCYCGGGNRSALAAKSLHGMGFDRVSSLKGGWAEWTSLGLATEG